MVRSRFRRIAMTKREAVVLASRALALYLICWGLSDATYLPQVLLDVHRHWNYSSVLVSEIRPDYYLTYHVVQLVLYLFRIGALLLTACWLIKHGEGVHRYFLPPEASE